MKSKMLWANALQPKITVHLLTVAGQMCARCPYIDLTDRTIAIKWSAHQCLLMYQLMEGYQIGNDCGQCAVCAKHLGCFNQSDPPPVLHSKWALRQILWIIMDKCGRMMKIRHRFVCQHSLLLYFSQKIKWSLFHIFSTLVVELELHRQIVEHKSLGYPSKWEKQFVWKN